MDSDSAVLFSIWAKVYRNQRYTDPEVKIPASMSHLPATAEAVHTTRRSGSKAGRSVWARMNEPVPVFTHMSPGATTPSPTAAACWSPPAATTGMGRRKPSSLSMEVFTSPTTVPGGTASGKTSTGMPNRSQSPGSHASPSMLKSMVREAWVQSVTKAPVRWLMTRSWTVRNLWALRNTWGLFSLSQRSLGRVKYGSIRRPVLRYTSSSPNSSRIVSVWLTARLSCQSMALARGVPRASTGVTVERWEMTEMAAMESGSREDCLTALTKVFFAPLIQVEGS